MSDREKPPFVLLTILFLGICSPLTCQTPTVPLSTEISPPLEDDLRLDKKISATERVITLAELTRHFSDAKITLAVSNECREQKIHLRLRNRSLRSVMKALADWLPGDWIAENKGKTYRLIRKPSYVIKCDRWWRRFLEGREEAIKRMKMAYLKALKQDGISHDESGKINTDETLVRGGAGLTALCRALPEDLLERSVDTLDLRPRYSKDYIVSSSELTKIATCKVKISDLTADAQKIIEKMFANSPSASQITQLRFFASPGGWNIAFTNDQGGAREILSRGAGLPLLNDALISLNQAGLEQALKWHGYVPAKTPSNWQWLVETQKRSFWNKPPARRNPPVFGFPDRSEVMDRLARQKNMDFIEDVYAVHV